MSSPTVTELIVCTTCRPAGVTRDQPAAGEHLMEALQVAELNGDIDPAVRLRGVACMSSCSRACTVALQAPGKLSYVFGDLQPELETVRQVLQCAAQHAASADGNLARNERPERLRSGILMRLPPLVKAPAH